MAKRRCANGHQYESDIYGDCCPFCVSTGLSAAKPAPLVRERLVVRPDTSAFCWENRAGSVPPEFKRDYTLTVGIGREPADAFNPVGVELATYNYDGLLNRRLYANPRSWLDDCLRQIASVELYQFLGRNDMYSVGGGRMELRLYDGAGREYFRGYSEGHETGTLDGDLWGLNEVMKKLVPDFQQAMAPTIGYASKEPGVLRGRQSGKIYRLMPGRNVLCRWSEHTVINDDSTGNRIYVDDPQCYISRREQVYIDVSRQGDDTFVYSLVGIKSPNPNCVNNRRVVPSEVYLLQPGDIVRLALTEFEFLV